METLATTSTSPKQAEPPLDHLVVAQLKAENEQLKEMLAKLKAKHEGVPVGEHEEDIAGKAANFYDMLQKSILTHAKNNQDAGAPRPIEESKIEESKARELRPTKSSALFASGIAAPGSRDKSAIYVCKSGSGGEGGIEDEFLEGDDSAFVCVMDVNDDDWWEIIEPETEDFEPVVVEDPDDSYEIIDDESLTKALSDFVVSTIKHHPETLALPPTAMKSMLDGTFVTLKKKGTLGQILEYGTLAYTVYGWGSYAWQLYAHPGLAGYVIKGLYTAGTWIICICLA